MVEIKSNLVKILLLLIWIKLLIISAVLKVILGVILERIFVSRDMVILLF